MTGVSGVPGPGPTLSPGTDTDGKWPHHRRPGHVRMTDAEKGPTHTHDDGAFDGSFAGTARRRTEAYVLPWYLRRQYFTEGWTDASIWRAAVRLGFS